MSEPPKSQSTFSFAAPASSAPTSSLFGQPNAASQSQSGLFGSTNQAATTSSPSSFLPPGNTGSRPLFGAVTDAAQPSNIFGGATASGGNMFGGGDKPTQSPFNFGPKPAGESARVSSISAQGQPPAGQQSNTSVSFSSLSTPSKPSESSSTDISKPSGLFGGGTSNLFQNPVSSAPGGSFTPSNKPAPLYSFGSTTPAGPPPSSNAGASNPFNPNPSSGQQETKNLFSNLGSGSSSGQPVLNATQASSLGANPLGNLGRTGDSGSAKTSNSVASNNLFGSVGTHVSSDSSGGQTASSSPFGQALQSSASGEQKAAFSFPPAAVASPLGSGGQKSSSTTSNLFNLGGTSKTSEGAPSSASASTNLFGNFTKSTGTASSTNPSTASTSAGLFSNLEKTQGPSASTSTTAATTSAAASMPSIFGNPSQAPSSSGPAPSVQANLSATSGDSKNHAAAPGPAVGASTSGPSPTAQSRLKNKSMDEIIGRWASDLAKYQKEFQKQAEKVATWDRMLVDNSEKIQRLYGSTLDAERATAEVERQISAVENDQNELEAWLDKYEKDVDQMISAQGDSFHGPDSEREKTYQLAEKLSTRLEEMNKDLNSMVEEINDASSSLNKNAKPDDPLSQVVRVLNNHLAQLQQIDQGAAALQLKVSATKKASQTLGPSNGMKGPNSDAADGFYRSFKSRR